MNLGIPLRVCRPAIDWRAYADFSCNRQPGGPQPIWTFDRRRGGI